MRGCPIRILESSAVSVITVDLKLRFTYQVMTKTITTVPVAVPGFPKALIKFFENFHGNALRCEGMNCSLYTMVDWVNRGEPYGNEGPGGTLVIERANMNSKSLLATSSGLVLSGLFFSLIFSQYRD